MATTVKKLKQNQTNSTTFEWSDTRVPSVDEKETGHLFELLGWKKKEKGASF